MENDLTDASPAEDGKLDVTSLVSMFEAAEEASYTARKEAERDRDYHDGKQLSDEEIKALGKRGQPPYIDNRIKTKVDYLIGLEKQQRINPKALPRTPQHENDADAASQSLIYIADKELFDYKRSAVWRNLVVEGAGGFSVSVEPSKKYQGEFDVKLTRVPWDRMFWDPHSAETDFSDAGYLGTVTWMEYDDALAMYPDGADALDVTMASVTASDTYDDKPKYNLWADKKRRRVRIVEIWVKRGDDWFFAEYTKGGILKAGPSPYVTDTGESDCGLFFQSAYADRDNNRYGLVREFIYLQDAINKRGSKATHLLNTAQIVTKKGAVDDIEKSRREAARPDGVLVINDMGGSLNDSFQFNTRADLSMAHVQMAQDAKNAIDLKGPNATAMGDKAQGSSAASGKAIIASQQGGMISLGDLLDNLRHLDLRVFRAMWNRIRQYWTAEKWIRVTDDDRNVKWVGLNVDPSRVQMASPEQQQMIAGVVGSIAELDCDIIIDEAPDSVVPALEQFEALVALKQFDTQGEIPLIEMVRAVPNLKNRDRFIKGMEEREQAKQNPQEQQIQQQAIALEFQGAQADVQKTQADAKLKEAQAIKAMREASMPAEGGQMQPQPQEVPIELQSMKTMAEVEKLQAGAEKDRASAFKTEQEARLAPVTLSLDAQNKAQDRESREKQFKRTATQAA